MKLKVINSNSMGNAYILENDREALLIECGVHFDKIKQALNFNLKKVVGCLVTHEHQDHCKAVQQVIKAGINVYASPPTHVTMGTENSHRKKFIRAHDEVKVGGFTVKAFDVMHDAAEPLGFLIHHQETGLVLFLTDSYYSAYKFPVLNNIIIEANYCQTILDQRLMDGMDPKSLRDRTITSHMSLQTCKGVLLANELKAVNNIVLIHLSDRNSDEKRFKREVEGATGKTVHVATAGLVIDFNISPF